MKLFLVEHFVNLKSIIMLIDFRTLFPKYNVNPKGVLHVGANVGEEAPVYLELGIKRQVWIEANPEIYEKLKANISSNSEAVALLNCIGDIQNENVVFHVSNNEGQSSSILELGTHAIVHPSVTYIQEIKMKAVRIDTLRPEILEELDLLNIDLQGAELKALKGMGELLYQFNWAYLEVNKEELYVGCALIGEIDDYLAKYDLQRVETHWAGNTGWGDAFYVRKTLL